MSVYNVAGNRCTVILISNETYELTKNIQNCKQNFASARRVETKAIFLQYSQVNEAVVSQTSATCTECRIFWILCICMSVLPSHCSEKLTARLRWLRSKRSRERVRFFILSLNTYWSFGLIFLSMGFNYEVIYKRDLSLVRWPSNLCHFLPTTNLRKQELLPTDSNKH